MYRKGNKTKIITSLVLVLVLGLSLGFAAFTNTLKITPQATITPDSATFDIDFSSSSSSVVANDITPTLTGTGLTAEAAEIDNSTNPTISNLTVNFTKPGQKAEYKFYAYNNGAYLAYLTSVNFLNPEGKDAFITCEAVESTAQYVDEACNGIKVSIKVGSLTTDVTKEGISGHSLAKQTAEEVIVTIEYEEGSAVADGAFTADIGDITLVYSTLDSQLPGIKIAANPTHNLYLFGETFLIDSNTTWQQLIDGSNGKLTSSIEYDDLLVINDHCLKFFSNGDENGGMPNLYESNLSSKIVSKFGNKSPLDGGDFALSDWSNSIACPSIPDDGSTYCQVDFEYALEQDSNNVAYIESLS